MDHVEVMRDKTRCLRLEIAEIQHLNKQYRLQGRNGEEAQVAHGQRQERLQAIHQELTQLAALGRKVQSIDQMKEKYRFRLHVVKEASQPFTLPRAIDLTRIGELCPIRVGDSAAKQNAPNSG